MTAAVQPRWHGDNYQARIFWLNALNLLDESSSVSEVTFEADGPKAFDDVVVKFEPPVAHSGPDRVAAEFHQVKWHTDYGGRFGYADLTDPAFIGAQTVSILQRLQQARRTAPALSRFALITVHRITDGDPLGRLVSGNDKSLLMERLFDGTTDKSAMGRVRKLWRRHLDLRSDDDLRAVVSGLRIIEGYRSLDELRAEINFRAQSLGLMSFNDSTSDFRYDDLARQLKIRGINHLTRESLKRFCQEEGLVVAKPSQSDALLPIAIRSFLGSAADIVGATPDNTLLLVDDFRNRYLRDGTDWQRDIRPKVESFLRAAVIRSPGLRLILDAHASIAFLSGRVLDLKSGARVDLVQKGRVGAHVWRAGDGPTGPLFRVTEHALGSGPELAVVISASQPAETHARSYIGSHLPQLGKLLLFESQGGPGQQSVLGGRHAGALSDQISNCLRAAKAGAPDALVHIFAACPNSLLFFLGQQHQAIAPCMIYEFDFDRRGDKTYHPSFVMD